jgi:hypothetical protein
VIVPDGGFVERHIDGRERQRARRDMEKRQLPGALGRLVT